MATIGKVATRTPRWSSIGPTERSGARADAADAPCARVADLKDDTSIAGLEGSVGTEVTLAHLVERVGWSAVCVAMLGLAVLGAAPADIAIVATALWGGYRCWSCADGPSRRLQALLLAMTAMSIVVSLVSQGVSYGTDELAFGQYSASLVLRGLNPFTHSLAPSLALYHVPASYATHYLNGSQLTTASYPAGSFLFYLPALALGLHAEASLVTDAAFWVLGMILLWALLPRSVNWVAGLFLASSIYIGYALGGVSDCLYVPFVILALWRWDRYGDAHEPSIARWIGPIALGVAMSVKQTPWFLLGFLLIGVAFEARAQGLPWLRRPARYLVVCVGVFTAINAPWIVASPHAWLDGILVPLTASFVPIGQGLISLSLLGHFGGGDLMLYTLAGAAWLATALALMGLRYKKTKRVWVFLVIASFFFIPRSFGSYLLMLTPGAILAAASVGGTSNDDPLVRTELVRKLSGAALVISMLAVAGAAASAMATPAPLDMSVLGLRTNAQLGLVTAATLGIHNNTTRTLHPTFAVATNGIVTNFWTPVGRTRGPVTIGPHQTETLTLGAPDVASMPKAQSSFRIFGYTTGPAALSSTQGYTTSNASTYLTPDAVEAPVRVGTRLVFSAQLFDGGAVVRRSGVVVDLAQMTPAQGGLGAGGGVASIDGQPVGVLPASATTNAEGIATFVVTGTRADANPTFFQTWIAPTAQYAGPTGYSEPVAVRFSP